MLLNVPGPAGRLEALLDEPSHDRGVSADGLVHEGRHGAVRAAVVFAHPHPQRGGTMHTKVVFHAAKTLVRMGCAVLRFNFRGVGTSEGVFDDGQGEKADFGASLDFMSTRYPGTPIWAAGMSFGAWIALSVGAEDPRVSVLLGIATPVTNYDFSGVASSEKTKFFIHGEFDEVCSLKDMRELYARAAEPKELVVIDAADHLFDGRVTEVADTVEDLLGDWSG